MAGLYPDSNRAFEGEKTRRIREWIPSVSSQAEPAAGCGSCKAASSTAAVGRADRGFCPVITLPSATAVGTNRRPKRPNEDVDLTRACTSVA